MITAAESCGMNYEHTLLHGLGLGLGLQGMIPILALESHVHPILINCAAVMILDPSTCLN